METPAVAPTAVSQSGLLLLSTVLLLNIPSFSMAVIIQPSRKWKHIFKRAWRGTGGVGLLIKLRLVRLFDIEFYVSSSFTMLPKSSFSVCVCYLPPIGSSRGDLSLEFLDSLLLTTTILVTS